MRRRPKVEIKTAEQLELMRQAGLVVARTLGLLRDRVEPGVTTSALDELAAQFIKDSGAKPSFLGYYGYPATICVSVNEEVVHGIPGSRVLREGDLVSIDCGAIVDGWHGDAAISVPVGEVSAEVARLSQVTEESLWAGLAAAVAGGRLTDIGAGVQARVQREAQGYGIVVDYVGHGIGSRMHMPPNVPNIGPGGKGVELVPGMALAVEPMITLGSPEVKVLADGWTVVSVDGKTAAHWEHTVAITETGPCVLTDLDGGQSQLTGAA